MTSITVLYAASCGGLTFAEALEAAPAGTALLSTPWRYEVLTTADAMARPPDGVFEARVFDEHAELRWHNKDDGRGTAVLLAEDSALLPAGFDGLKPVRATSVIPGTYLLWGTAIDDTKAPSGYSTLTTARVGVRRVPAEIPVKEHAAIETREYVTRDDVGKHAKGDKEHDEVHGNAYVAEERLLRIATAQPHDLGTDL